MTICCMHSVYQICFIQWFSPSAALSRDIFPKKRSCPWYFCLVALYIVIFCLDFVRVVFFGDFLSRWRFILWHSILWHFIWIFFVLLHFVHVVFSPVTVCLASGVYSVWRDILSRWYFILWNFVRVAFCPVTFVWYVIVLWSCIVFCGDPLSSFAQRSPVFRYSTRRDQSNAPFKKYVTSLPPIFDPPLPCHTLSRFALTPLPPLSPPK